MNPLEIDEAAMPSNEFPTLGLALHVQAEAGEGSRVPGRPFFFDLQNWTCGLALAALEPGRYICGAGRGRFQATIGVRAWLRPARGAVLAPRPLRFLVNRRV